MNTHRTSPSESCCLQVFSQIMSRLLWLLLLPTASSVHRQAAHHQLLQLVFLPSLYPFSSAKLCTTSPSPGQELPQIIDRAKKREKKTLSKPEYKSPVIKQWHSRGGEANLRCWAWLCHVGCDTCASGTELLWGFMPLQLRTRNYSFLVWGVSKWTAIVEITN